MRNDLFRACALTLVTSLLFTISDTTAKYVTAAVPAVEVAAIRYAVFMVIAGAPWALNRHASAATRRPGLQIVRGLGVVGSSIFFILALGSLPIAEATALNFITPLVITVLAIPVLGEKVRLQGWLAVGLGFCGMLVMIRPGTNGIQPAAVLILLSSLCWSVAMLATRRLAFIDRPQVTLLWTSATGFLVLMALLPFFLKPVTWTQAGLCVMIGIVSSTAQSLAVQAYRYARATVLAPLNYIQLIWASVLGYVVFGALPDRYVILGAVIIAVSGIYVVQLERVRSRETDEL